MRSPGMLASRTLTWTVSEYTRDGNGCGGTRQSIYYLQQMFQIVVDARGCLGINSCSIRVHIRSTLRTIIGATKEILAIYALDILAHIAVEALSGRIIASATPRSEYINDFIEKMRMATPMIAPPMVGVIVVSGTCESAVNHCTVTGRLGDACCRV